MARVTAKEISDLLSEVNGSKGEKNENKLLRDKAYSLLHSTLNEIRECGRYVFWKDEERKSQ